MNRHQLWRSFTCFLVVLLTWAYPLTAMGQSLLEVRNRFLDGTVDMRPAKLPRVATIIDAFEDATAYKKDWAFFQGATGQLVAEHASAGKHSLKVTLPRKGSFASYRKGSAGWGNAETDGLAAWSAKVLFNDEARLDVFNPQDQNVTLLVSMGKTFRFELKPGRNELVMPTRAMLPFAYRATAILPGMRLAVDDADPVTLYFDHFRWVGPGVGENLQQFGKCLDAGPIGDPWTRPGFLTLSSKMGYDQQRGYGWEKPGELEFAYDLLKMLSPGTSGRQPHDPLIRNCIVRAQGPLLVDLPDGQYRLHWVEGHIFAYPGTNNASEYDLSIRVGEKVIPIRTGARDFAERVRYFYGRDRVDYLPGEDRWSKYMSDLFSPWECDVNVKGGQLKLEFLTDPPGRANICFLLIYPVAKANVIEPEVAALWHDIRDRFNHLCYQEATPEMAKAMNLPGLHEEFLHPDTAVARAKKLAALPMGKSGLLAFRREPIEDVYPDTVPAAADVADEVTSFGPPGEIASMAINLYALKDVKQLKVDVGAFVAAHGGKLPGSAVDLRFVRYSYRMSGQQSHGDWTYMVMPWFLVQRNSVEVKKGMSVRWWLNVDVPPDAVPGRYQAKARISADGIVSSELTLTLEVLPIRLDAVPNGIEFAAHWSMRQEWAPSPDGGYYGVAARMDKAKAQVWAKVLRDALHRRTAGEFHLMKRYGLNLIYDRQLPDISILPLALPAELTKILPMEPSKDAATRKAYIGGTYVEQPKDVTAEKVQALKASGKPPILFGPPKGWADVQQEAGIYRFCSGFFLWRLGAAGCVYDPWRSDWGDPYHPFDNHVGEWGSLCVPASHDWPTLNSSVVLEGIREGILDYRYLISLERLVKDRADTAPAKEAVAYLNELKGRIKGDASHYFMPVGRGGGWDATWHQKDTCWRGDHYAGARHKLASLIARFEAKP